MSTINYASYQSEDLVYNHTCYTPPPEITLHVHDICELLFLKKGDVAYIVDGKSYRLTKNCLVISRPLKGHALSVYNDSEYDRYNILFDEKKLTSDIFHRIPEHVNVVNFDGNSVVSNLFKKMDYYCESFDGELLQTTLLHLAEEVLLNVLITSHNPEENSAYTVNSLINQALKYIDQNITTPIRIENICEELFITKSHLHHLFIKHLKVSPKKYIMSQKLILAQRELRSGSKPTEAALNCGFADYSTFYRDYKHFFGHSPSDEGNVKMIREIKS